jgi:hypothetical protein
LNEFLERLKIWKFILALRNYKPGKEKQTLSYNCKEEVITEI